MFRVTWRANRLKNYLPDKRKKSAKIEIEIFIFRTNFFKKHIHIHDLFDQVNIHIMWFFRTKDVSNHTDSMNFTFSVTFELSNNDALDTFVIHNINITLLCVTTILVLFFHVHNYYVFPQNYLPKYRHINFIDS